jgi:hypothetical protein
MDTRALRTRGRLVEPPAEESRDLLDPHAVGRIALCGPEGPVVLPHSGWSVLVRGRSRLYPA